MAQGKGLRDWKVQRLSAIFMVIYLAALVIWGLRQPEITYTAWQGLFSSLTLRLGTPLFVGALAWHAWIGAWTVGTDYIPAPCWRFVYELIIAGTLVVCTLWSALIVWSCA